jgi:hypothetical protein
MNKKHIRSLLRNKHVRKQDLKHRTADHSVVGVSPITRIFF